MEKNLNFKNINSDNNFEDEIDLKNIFYFILRNKILIGITGLIAFILSYFYSLTLKKVWEGQFQIVLNSQQESRINSLSPVLSNFIRRNGTSNINTQVGILKSPSVLMPIYELANGRIEKGLNNKISFSNWLSNLDVGLQQGTSILNISYRDTKKEIILPVLENMSLIYQGYTKNNKKREEELTEKYLINQINLFREKSANSIKEAQNYAIDQDLIYEQNMYYSGNGNTANSQNPILPAGQYDSGSLLNIERNRVLAANEIRIINSQLKKINELDPTDYESLQYFGSSIPALTEEGLPDTLKKIESQLVNLRSKFTEKEPAIIRLLEQRKLSIDLLKTRAIKYLKVAKLEAEAKMEAAMRPKGVLLKYRELRREAARDEKTLFSLENDLRLHKLQQARLSVPWQLITQPTLLKNPVAPSKKIISFFGLTIGLGVGSILAAFKEKKSDKIYSIQNLEQLLSTLLIERISKNDQMIHSKQVNFLKEFLKTKNQKVISFITLEDVNNSYLQNLRDFLIKEMKSDTKINVITSQIPLENCKISDFSILFTSLNYSSYSEIKTLKNKFTLLDIDLKGLVLLDE